MDLSIQSAKTAKQEHLLSFTRTKSVIEKAQPHVHALECQRQYEVWSLLKHSSCTQHTARMLLAYKIHQLMPKSRAFWSEKILHPSRTLE